MIPKAHVITIPSAVGTSRWRYTSEHLASVGVDYNFFPGIDGDVWGLETILPYGEDAPGTGYRIGGKVIGISLSHYMLWTVLSKLPGPYGNFDPWDYFWINEDDVRFVADWRSRLEQALIDVPRDWDMLYVGSCCCADKKPDQVRGNVWRVQYPTCAHSYMVRRKALPIMLETQQLAWAGIDTQLIFRTHPLIKVYTILPRLVEQQNTHLTE